jgi:regulator of sirC expression with transglutaminase-like and TPR domain
MTDALDRFRAAVSREDPKLDLAEAALLIALDDYPDLDTRACLAEIEKLGRTLHTRLPADFSPLHRVIALNRYLFVELGFQANADDYYDPANNLLNVVLERRTGIPITLSILYLEIGRRIGLRLQGVSFPGHFLVKLPTAEGDLILDPYSKGKSLSESDLRRRLGELAHDIDPAQLPLQPFLAAVPKREILARMLRNLKGIHLQRNALPQALSMINRILIVAPDAAHEWRDRGLVFERLDCFRAAVTDLETYLELDPGAEDSKEVLQRIAHLRLASARLH